MICARLKIVNIYKETFWYVESWPEWKEKPGFRYIKTTTQDMSQATCFDTAEQAAEVLAKADNPDGWEIVVTEYEKPVVKIVTANKPKPAKPTNPGNK